MSHRVEHVIVESVAHRRTVNAAVKLLALLLIVDAFAALAQTRDLSVVPIMAVMIVVVVS